MNASALVCAGLAVGAPAAAQDLQLQAAPPPPTQQEFDRLQARVAALEQERAAPKDGAVTPSIDLSGEEYGSIDAARAVGVSDRRWYDRIHISGYGAAGYYDSGAPGAVHDGSFLVKEASLFVEAEVIDHVSFFYEMWISRYLYDDGTAYNDGELYLRFSDLFGTADGARLGAKVGRIDVPFGEDYLERDAIDGQLISLSVADVWAIDEGAEVFGRAGALRWVAAVTNGNIQAGADDSPSKLYCAKIYGDVAPDLFLSASGLWSGDTNISTLWFGRGLITPVGLFGGSTAGTSPSTQVQSTLWEVDARIGSVRRVHADLQFGQAFIDDDANAFDRTMIWWKVEPEVQVASGLALVARYSMLGTDDSGDGYSIQGDIFGPGSALGYDTHRMQRVACGLVYTLNPHLKFKFEVGRDWLDVIAGSPFDASDFEEFYGAAEIVASF